MKRNVGFRPLFITSMGCNRVIHGKKTLKNEWHRSQHRCADRTELDRTSWLSQSNALRLDQLSSRSQNKVHEKTTWTGVANFLCVLENVISITPYFLDPRLLAILHNLKQLDNFYMKSSRYIRDDKRINRLDCFTPGLTVPHSSNWALWRDC